MYITCDELLASMAGAFSKYQITITYIFLKIPFGNILPLSKWYFCKKFPYQNCVCVRACTFVCPRQNYTPRLL